MKEEEVEATCFLFEKVRSIKVKPNDDPCKFNIYDDPFAAKNYFGRWMTQSKLFDSFFAEGLFH